jgi:hypothetical protein
VLSPRKPVPPRTRYDFALIFRRGTLNNGRDVLIFGCKSGCSASLASANPKPAVHALNSKKSNRSEINLLMRRGSQIFPSSGHAKVILSSNVAHRQQKSGAMGTHAPRYGIGHANIGARGSVPHGKGQMLRQMGPFYRDSMCRSPQELGVLKAHALRHHPSDDNRLASAGFFSPPYRNESVSVCPHPSEFFLVIAIACWRKRLGAACNIL